MIFAKDLILKGVAGLAVVGGLGAGGIYVWNQRKEESLQFLTEMVGLSCTGTPNETTGVQCNKKEGENVKVKVKQDNATIELSDISGTGKIKVYKLTATNGGTTGYNKDFKFVIEDNDISESGNKLEQFETYEIKQEGGDWRLTRRDEANIGKEKALGLPAGCKLPSTNTQTCNDVVLDAGKLKLINFEGKGSTENLTVEDGANLKLTITKLTGSDTDFPNGGYKFVFKTNKDINIPKSSTGNITLKSKTNPEFKIKKAETGNALTLEKAWTAKSLGTKVGLECNEPTEGAEKSCTLKETGINVHNGDNKKHTNLSRGDNNNNKKIKYEVDVEDYNQGFKFFTEETDGITLQNGNNGEGKKIENKGSGSNTAFYEIKQEETTWYLIKKPAPAA